jgi:hypothetical protein
MPASFAMAESLGGGPPPLLRVGPLTVDRADVWLALSTLDFVRVTCELEGLAGEFVLARLPFRDAMWIPRRLIADLTAMVQSHACVTD